MKKQTLTVKQARKILGIGAKSLSDKEIGREIQLAILLKELFFSQLLISPRYSSKEIQNMP